MKSRKGLVILFAVVFAMAFLCSIFLLLNVREIRVKFTLYTNIDQSSAYEKLQEHNGKNLLFVSENEILESVKEFPKFKVTKISKQFPNVINVEISERREVYRVNANEKIYSLDREGFVIGIFPETASLEDKRDVIEVNLEGITVSTTAVGEYLQTSDEALFKSMLSMSEYVKLSDCVESIFLNVGPVGSDVKDVVLNTYTGVDIRVTEADKRSEDKIKVAYNCYNNDINDYRKTFSVITVLELRETNEIRATWDER